MTSISLTVDLKTTESLRVLIAMREDIQSLIELIPDYVPEKHSLAESLNTKWKRFAELVESSKSTPSVDEVTK